MGHIKEDARLLGEPESGTRRIVEGELARVGVALRSPLELSGCEAVKRAVAAGLGVSIVTRYSLDLEVGAGLLKVVPLPELRLRRELSIVLHEEVRPSAAARDLLPLVGERPPSVD